MVEGIEGLAARFYAWVSGRSPLMKDLYVQVAKHISERVRSGSILDVGTGPGRLPVEIAKLAPDTCILGVDISEDMVKIARRNAESACLSGRVRFEVGDVANLPLESDSYDFVVSTVSMHHWRDPVRGLNEVFRVLKPGGEAWIYDIRTDSPPDAEGELRRRYGRFVSFILINAVRPHSSISLKRVKDMLEDPSVNFREKSVEELGVMLKIELRKSLASEQPRPAPVSLNSSNRARNCAAE